jgi:hypothetical protein
MEVQISQEKKEIEFVSFVEHIILEKTCIQHLGGYYVMAVTKNTKNETVIGIISNNKLVGLYHTKEYCPHLLREQKKTKGNIKQLKRKVSRSHPCFCRHCIYLEAEEQGINCFEICPQQVCMEKNSIPEAMRKEIQEVNNGRKNTS